MSDVAIPVPRPHVHPSSRRVRQGVVIGAHAALIAACSLMAFLLRFDNEVPPTYRTLAWQSLPFLMAAQMTLQWWFRLYDGLWRYTSLPDLRDIVLSTVMGSGAFFLLWPLSGSPFPRSILLIDVLLLIGSMVGIRMVARVPRRRFRGGQSRSVLIYGAGDAGEMVVRDMLNGGAHGYAPVGFIDDDPAKQGTRIHGVPVLGTGEDLPGLVNTHRPAEVVVAMPSAGPAAFGRIVSSLHASAVPLKTLPGLHQIPFGRALARQLRDLRIEDLLDRPAVGLDRAPLERLIAGRRVLITGAGGSIGAELARQVASLGPQCLTLVDRYENGLFGVVGELKSGARPQDVRARVGDVTDRARLDAIFAADRPEIVFHAAAHKHVPLMEANPCEAVKNNVRGTRIALQAATDHGVSRFVLVSTDKAVNPTSVMGATKRVAERLVQHATETHTTACVAVRFGNVLASNGSVVPTFLDQIARGGPVTVTHPDVQRYFMTIPEAVQLVLHAGALSEPGSLYVLEMGEQIRLVDLARHMIRLSGYVPHTDIPITFTGLRPGEKLSEELVASDEVPGPSHVDRIRRVRPADAQDLAAVQADVLQLEDAALRGDEAETLRLLHTLVPTYQDSPASAGGRPS